MLLLDERHVDIDGKGHYENAIEEGEEVEWLNGVGLIEGHYCKHYRWMQDWSDMEHVDAHGIPLFQHYCGKGKKFGGWSYCCSRWCNGFEKGKSAGVKRARNKIWKERQLGITQALRQRCYNIRAQLNHFQSSGQPEHCQEVLTYLDTLIYFSSNPYERRAYQDILDEYAQKYGC